MPSLFRIKAEFRLYCVANLNKSRDCKVERRSFNAIMGLNFSIVVADRLCFSKFRSFPAKCRPYTFPSALIFALIDVETSQHEWNFRKGGGQGLPAGDFFSGESLPVRFLRIFFRYVVNIGSASNQSCVPHEFYEECHTCNFFIGPVLRLF
ncbi:hypothetical protein TcasGA2_TC012590 [Tribolium castaneum]|uniref:Uncharacterized protein n=1 Tax=Tribolium castaneum TaxID=7070 RepID=D6X3D4_TRICA|nr:hypothetical protein TcasGA2_TC012590 [Tribolium castaneum]